MFGIMGSDEPPPSLPWHANPAMGAVIGMTFLLFCLVGPFALLIPLIGWLVIRHRRQEGMRSTAFPMTGECAASGVSTDRECPLSAQSTSHGLHRSCEMERETGLEPATSTLGRSRSAR